MLHLYVSEPTLTVHAAPKAARPEAHPLVEQRSHKGSDRFLLDVGPSKERPPSAKVALTSPMELRSLHAGPRRRVLPRVLQRDEGVGGAGGRAEGAELRAAGHAQLQHRHRGPAAARAEPVHRFIGVSGGEAGVGGAAALGAAGRPTLRHGCVSRSRTKTCRAVDSARCRHRGNEPSPSAASGWGRWGRCVGR